MCPNAQLYVLYFQKISNHLKRNIATLTKSHIRNLITKSNRFIKEINIKMIIINQIIKYSS